MKNALIGLIVGIVVVGLMAGLRSPQSSPDSPQAEYNSARNGFIVGCEEEAKKYTGTEFSCSCAFNKLDEMYPDFTTNVERINRITSEGYNLAETKELQKCLVNTQEG